MVHRSLELATCLAFKNSLFLSRSAGIRTEMKDVEVHSAHLLSVNYHRVARGLTTNNSGHKVLDEKLQLAVLFDITEHLHVTRPDSEAGAEVEERRCNAIWQFESKVTTPEDIDWMIEMLQLDA